jgi:hypothetical protein
VLASGGAGTVDDPQSPSTPGPAPALLTLKAQLDAAYPLRNRASDGIMADARHIAEGKSDHILGNAFDITTDPVNGPDNAALAVALLRDSRTHYTIFEREIRNVEIQDGAARAYTGADPHTSHLHVSIYAARRDDTSPWDLGSGSPPDPNSASPADTTSDDTAPADTGLAVAANIDGDGDGGGDGGTANANSDPGEVDAATTEPAGGSGVVAGVLALAALTAGWLWRHDVRRSIASTIPEGRYLRFTPVRDVRFVSGFPIGQLARAGAGAGGAQRR